MGILDDIKDAVTGKSDAEADAVVEQVTEEVAEIKAAKKAKAPTTNAAPADGALVSGPHLSGPMGY